MPGGEQAIREPWRMALAHLLDAGWAGPDRLRTSVAERRVVRTMLDRGLNSPPTSSAGRLFDAVAALAGVRDRVSFEGQAAIELEGLAADTATAGGYPFALSAGPACVVDTRPLIRAVAEDAAAGVTAPVIARRFHTSMVEIITAVCDRIRADTGLGEVVLSGGVFLNALLTAEVCTRLEEVGFRVSRHRLVPPGDGGLSLGQLAVAAHDLQRTLNSPTETPGCASESPAR
jgi:hydrogenase maturation protein HypF